MAACRANRAAALGLALALAGCTSPGGQEARPSPAPTAAPPATVTRTPGSPPPTTAEASPSPFPPSCRGYEGLRTEVDGDGRPDVAFVAEIGGETTLGVCTGAGRYATLHVAGMGELFQLLDVDRDGRDELLAGGTSVSGGGVDVVRYDRGRLRFVTTAGGQRFALTFDHDGQGDGVEQAWGCRPERRELVQVTVDWRRRTARTETYVLRGLRAVRTSVTTEPASGEPGREYAGEVAGPCPGLRG